MKSLILVFLYFISLYGISTDMLTPKMAVEYASNAYLSPLEFKQKYKTSTNKVGFSIYNGVRFFAVEEKDYVIFLFRGTASIKNAKTDINAGATTFLDIADTKVHKGFYDVALNSKKIFRKLIVKGKPIFIIGHSLGGAISILLGSILKYDGYDDVLVYTFGSPPVGNQKFVESIKGLKHYRYVHINDPVAKIDEKFATKLNAILDKIESKLKDKTKYKSLLYGVISLKHTFSNLNYDYVHDDYKTIFLDGKTLASKKLKKYPFWIKLMFTPFKAHTMDTYRLNINQNL